jgi:hypothetical protein
VNYHLPPAPKVELGQVPEMVGGFLKVNNSRGPMVNVINAISGGSNEPVLFILKVSSEYFLSFVEAVRCSCPE